MRCDVRFLEPLRNIVENVKIRSTCIVEPRRVQKDNVSSTMIGVGTADGMDLLSDRRQRIADFDRRNSCCYFDELSGC
jgi:hypothetical protein